jgi:LuxR family maltose regulon positive regulatory protein
MRQVFNCGQQTTVRRWLEALSDADVADCPPLAAGAAWIMALLGERAATRRYLSVLEQAPFSGPFPLGENSTRSAVALLKAALGWEGVSVMRTQAEFACGLEPRGKQAREFAALSLGANLWLRGRTEPARVALEEAATIGASGANMAVFALGLLSLIHLEARQYDEADTRIREGFLLVDERGLDNYLTAAGLFVARAWRSVQRGDQTAATADLERASALLPMATALPWWSISLGVLAGRVARAVGKLDQAASLLTQARRELARYPDAGVLPHLLSAEEHALDTARAEASVLCEPLTEAELRVLELAPTHLTLEEIGRDRCISRNTVKTHLRAIYNKLNVSSRSEAVARAQALGLLGPRAVGELSKF